MCIRLPAGIDIDMACPHIAKEYEEEMFCLVDDGFDPLKIAAFVWNGFFPMASRWSGKVVSLAKIHERRCVLRLDDVHITRKVRKRAQRFGGVRGAHEERAARVLPNRLYIPDSAALFRAIAQVAHAAGVERPVSA